MGAGGDDGIGKTDPGCLLRSVHLQGIAVQKGAVAKEPGDLAGLAQAVEAARQLGDDPGLVAAQGVEINLRWSEGDAECSCDLRLFDDGGGMEQGLGRDAAHIEADPAEPRSLLDQANRKTKVSRPEGCRIAARSAAQHRDVGFQFVHHAVSPAGKKGMIG